MSNIPVSRFPPPSDPTPLPERTYATWSDPLENLRYRHEVMQNLACDHDNDFEEKRLEIAEISKSLKALGYNLHQRRLAPATTMTHQIRALITAGNLCQVRMGVSRRAFEETVDMAYTLFKELEFANAEHQVEMERQRFGREEEARIRKKRALNRARKGKGKEVMENGESSGSKFQTGHIDKGVRYGEASSSKEASVVDED